MREDFNIFDEAVRDKLDDARVSAPGFVWNEVNSHLHEMRGQSRRPSPLWFGALAACAMAVVAAVLFVMPAGQVGVVPQSHCKALALSQMPSVVELFDTDVKPIADLQRRTPSLHSAALGGADTLCGESLQQTPMHDETGVRQDEVPDESNDTWDDPFADMMAEDIRAARIKREPVSVRIGGVVGANDAHSSSFMSRPLWASGYVHDGLNENSVSSFMIPVSLGVSFRYPVSDRFAVGAGIDWSMLNRRFGGSYKTAEGEFTHRVNYIGIPVMAYYNVVQTRSFMLYAYGGGSIDKLISSKYYLLSESSSPIARDSARGVQLGLRAGFGCSFRLTDLMSLYFDPYVGYYFPGNQPKTLRTEHPLMVSFEAGLKFSL